MTVRTNAWRHDAAGNLRGTTQGTRQTLLTVNGDNELTTSGDVTNQGVAAVEQVDVAGQVEPGPNSNKWYASTASAKGQAASVSQQDGSFAITNVPVTAGANALTATVQDVSGNVATQMVNFTVQTVTNRSQFAYDANGNMTSSSAGVSPVFVYQYDAENRLVSVTSNGVTVLQCWYDGSGHRIGKREIIGTQTNAVQYVWDGWTLVAVLGEDGQLLEYYTRGFGIAGDIGTLISATYYAAGVPSTTCYLHNNHRGDVILAREGTSTVAMLDYSAYGELRSQSGSYTPRFRFSSKEYDASTGFYHFPYRYYAPQWARWTIRDAIGELGGDLNMYGYVRGNPVGYVDTYGLEVTCTLQFRFRIWLGRTNEERERRRGSYYTLYTEIEYTYVECTWERVDEVKYVPVTRWWVVEKYRCTDDCGNSYTYTRSRIERTEGDPFWRTIYERRSRKVFTGLPVDPLTATRLCNKEPIPAFP
jgi:RHS repeat-associated protein